MMKSVWNVDSVHSEIGFSIKHMMISKAKGNFISFDGEIKADLDQFTDAEIKLTIDVSSVDTRNKGRDDHLRSADFFDVENHPKATFISKEIKKTSDNHYEVIGDLTLKGTTKTVALEVIVEGQSKDPMSGNTVAGFSGETTISRKDFDLTWNTTLETGGVLLSDDVKISFEIEAHKQD
ncbi:MULTISPECIES: YceI family protein [Virgibacillus]|uniref:YceI family protein n=1 Tax=Virgibacillus dokdonensis TaxID=302167 RepID=A0A2K9J4L3_9BACI|nr:MULTISPECIES: YceI family protein [Virgibacillus]AUJ26879.1 hypothetical protein A21D_03845 [Virgibacillus dokdonensis]NWO14937.1 YceI family protein [Virgibacillus sp.]